MIGKMTMNSGDTVPHRSDSPSLEDLMQLTVELWVVGLLVYHLGLIALGLI